MDNCKYSQRSEQVRLLWPYTNFSPNRELKQVFKKISEENESERLKQNREDGLNKEVEKRSILRTKKESPKIKN